MFRTCTFQVVEPVQNFCHSGVERRGNALVQIDAHQQIDQFRRGVHIKTAVPRPLHEGFGYIAVTFGDDDRRSATGAMRQGHCAGPRAHRVFAAGC